MTPHFTLSELTATNTGYDNTPPNHIVENLYTLAMFLERVRDCVGRPIMISSAYRSPDVNAKIGGSPTSDHMQGLAADIKVNGLAPASVARMIKNSGIKYDQLIVEPTWVHVGIGSRMRNQNLITKDGKTYNEFNG